MTLQSLPYRFLMYCLREYESALSRVVQLLRKYKRLRQHPRNTGPGWLALDHFTADGARRATSARGHKEAMPTTTIRPSARSGTLIHHSLPHSPRRSARGLTLPSRRTATSRAARLRPSQHTLSTTARIACATEKRCEATRQEGEESKGGGQQGFFAGTTSAPGETTRASIEAWQSSPPFRFRAPCPASPS